jgi:hypothetical protein
MISTEERLIEIAHRKERLSARAQAQRLAVAGTFQELQEPLSFVDRGWSIVRFLLDHPLLVAAGAAGLVVFRGRGIMSLATRAFSVWRLWRAVSAWSAGRAL